MAIQEIAKRCQRPIPLNLFDVNTERWLFSSGLKETTRRQEEKKTGEGGQPEVCELVEKRVSNRLYKLERASCAQLSSYLSDWANSSRIHQRRGGGEKIRQWKRPVLENFPSRFRECGRRQGDHIDDGTSITFRAI